MGTEQTASPDVVGSYAARIVEHLKASPSVDFTTAEISAALELSDRVVRMGLDRLVFTGAVRVSFRHTPHRRGSLPRQYRAA